MNILVSLLIGFIKLVSFITHPLFVYYSKGKRKCVPPLKNDLLLISATDLAKKIRERELSSQEICRAYIDRIKEVNPIINAVVEERFRDALKDAKKVDDYLNKSSLREEELEKIKPLLGVPVTIKESCCVEGMSLCVGTQTRVGYRAVIDGEAVARVRGSGAIPLLVSNTPELCMSFETINIVTGATNNPYDTTCTSGGSSGGEGALLGAGASVIGIASDLAGSIREPAMFNGVFGHKPSPKVIPIKGHYPISNDENFSTYLGIGPMTRYAKDLKLMTKIMVGKKAAELRLNEKVDLRKIKVFFMEDAGKSRILPIVQKEIKQAVRDSAAYLEKNYGCKLSDYKFVDIKDSIEVGVSYLYSMKDIPNLLKGGNYNWLLEFGKSIMGQSEFSLQYMYIFGLQKIFALLAEKSPAKFMNMRNTFIEQLNNDGVLLLPTFHMSAFKHYEICFELAGVMYTIFANILGLPSTQVPCGKDSKGLPIGIQVIAGPNQDRLCLAVAEALEKKFGGWIPPR